MKIIFLIELKLKSRYKGLIWNQRLKIIKPYFHGLYLAVFRIALVSYVRHSKLPSSFESQLRHLFLALYYSKRK